jgi:hypothetical protein
MESVLKEKRCTGFFTTGDFSSRNYLYESFAFIFCAEFSEGPIS